MYPNFIFRSHNAAVDATLKAGGFKIIIWSFDSCDTCGTPDNSFENEKLNFINSDSSIFHIPLMHGNLYVTSVVSKFLT